MTTATLTPEAEAKTETANKVKVLPHRRYTVKGQKRVLFTMGKGHDCKLLDAPAHKADEVAAGLETPGVYVVERGLMPRAQKDQLTALLDDYVAQAKRHQTVPMTVFALTASLEAYAAA